MKFPFVIAFGLSFPFVCLAHESDTLKTHSIEAVVVQSYRSAILRRDVPALMDVVTRKDIARSTATSLSEIIKSFTPSESADIQGLTGGIEFRGFAPSASGTNTYTLMLTDGIRTGTRNAATIFLSGISSIELLKGPYSAIYGNGAMGGVINMNTPQSQDAICGRATLSYGSWQTIGAGVALGGAISKKLDFDLALDYFDRAKDYRTGSNNILKPTTYEKQVLDPHSRDTIYNNTSYDKSHAVLRLGYSPSRHLRFNFYNDIYYTGDAAANGSLWGMYDQTDKSVRRNFHRMDVTGKIGVHDLRVTPYLSFETSDYDNRGPWGNTCSEYEYNTYGIVAQDAIKLSAGTLIVGADNFSEHYESTQALEDGTPQAPYQPDYMSSQTGVFTQFNFQLFDGKFSAIAGLRYDNILFKTLKTRMLDMEEDSHDYNTLNPTLSMQYRIIPSLRVHAGVGRAFLAPDAYKTTGEYSNSWGFTYKGNPDLKPEISVNWEIGVGYASSDNVFEADLSLFFTNHENLVVSDNSNAAYSTFKNANKASIQGFESVVSFDLGRALKRDYSWEFSASATRIFHSEVITAIQSGERKYLSRTKATFASAFSHKRVMVAVSGRYIGKKTEDNFVYEWDAAYTHHVPFVTPSGAVIRPGLIDNPTIHTPDYMIFDMAASYRVLNKVVFGVKIANIFDELYMERDAYYMPGRNFSVNLSVDF